VADERLAIDAAIGAHLDGLSRVPDEIAALAHEMDGAPDERMMTHPDLGALLEVLVRSTGGRRVLEVGTFVGTSAAWMARGLAAGGRIDTLEADPARADAAERFFARAGIAGAITVHRGCADATLPALSPGYDLCYIDADKTGYPAYLEHTVRLVRPGGLVVADNVLLSGRVALPEDERGADAAALADFSRRAVDHPRLRTAVLTVGDGITLSVVLPA
jgi:predicted O-methyltransferase YrrM